jgi:hypothetical protein
MSASHVVSGSPGGRERFVRHAHRRQTVLARHLEDDAENGRMQVHVALRVDVIERQARRRERRELRADLVLELTAHARMEEVADAGAGKVRAEHPVAVDEIGDALGREQRPSFDDHDVQADAQ